MEKLTHSTACEDVKPRHCTKIGWRGFLVLDDEVECGLSDPQHSLYSMTWAHGPVHVSHASDMRLWCAPGSRIWGARPISTECVTGPWKAPAVLRVQYCSHPKR